MKIKENRKQIIREYAEDTVFFLREEGYKFENVELEKIKQDDEAIFITGLIDQLLTMSEKEKKYYYDRLVKESKIK